MATKAGHFDVHPQIEDGGNSTVPLPCVPFEIARCCSHDLLSRVDFPVPRLWLQVPLCVVLFFGGRLVGKRDFGLDASITFRSVTASLNQVLELDSL